MEQNIPSTRYALNTCEAEVQGAGRAAVSFIPDMRGTNQSLGALHTIIGYRFRKLICSGRGLGISRGSSCHIRVLTYYYCTITINNTATAATATATATINTTPTTINTTINNTTTAATTTITINTTTLSYYEYCYYYYYCNYYYYGGPQLTGPNIVSKNS